eukprot:1250573-Rhodomonas_salina.1
MSMFMGNGGFPSQGNGGFPLPGGMAGFIPQCQLSQGIGAGEALGSLSMPSPSLSLRALLCSKIVIVSLLFNLHVYDFNLLICLFLLFASPTSRPNTVAAGGISKMQQK